MSDSPFRLEEFTLRAEEEPKVDTIIPVEETLEPEEIDVQKAVVEELAAEKIELEAHANNLSSSLKSLQDELDNSKSQLVSLNSRVLELEKQLEEKAILLEKAEQTLAETKIALNNAEKTISEREEEFYDKQSRNPNALALLDRDVDLPDRFPGETRDHVLEVIKEARDKAEQEGRLRLAQVLEGVLVSNEPNGTLEQKREELRKLFVENMNIVNGTVIDKLTELNISYKQGEEYLTAEDIKKRSY